MCLVYLVCLVCLVFLVWYLVLEWVAQQLLLLRRLQQKQPHLEQGVYLGLVCLVLCLGLVYQESVCLGLEYLVLVFPELVFLELGFLELVFLELVCPVWCLELAQLLLPKQLPKLPSTEQVAWLLV